jgi:plastocyanin
VAITLGQTVRWTNNDTNGHTVVSSGLFDSGCLTAGQSYAFTFNVRGTFSYRDVVNGFPGTVTVN